MYLWNGNNKFLNKDYLNLYICSIDVIDCDRFCKFVNDVEKGLFNFIII